jgi:hypothetical protein
MTKVDLRREYQRGSSLNRLSQLTGRSSFYIRRQLHIAGVKIREPLRFPTDPDWWKAQIELGLSVKAIAAELDCSHTTVYRHLGSGQSCPVSFEDWLATRSRPVGACRRWTGGHSSKGYGTYHRT